MRKVSHMACAMIWWRSISKHLALPPGGSGVQIPIYLVVWRLQRKGAGAAAWRCGPGWCIWELQAVSGDLRWAWREPLRRAAGIPWPWPGRCVRMAGRKSQRADDPAFAYPAVFTLPCVIPQTRLAGQVVAEARGALCVTPEVLVCPTRHGTRWKDLSTRWH